VAADQVVAQTLYYVCAEALANVMRHSGATRVEIELTDNAQGIALSVRDNGLGVTSDPRPGGSGLAGLADRLRILGGRLELEDRPGGGAALVAEVPR
jgi:signal transduction histidine kinase